MERNEIAANSTCHVGRVFSQAANAQLNAQGCQVGRFLHGNPFLAPITAETVNEKNQKERNQTEKKYEAMLTSSYQTRVARFNSLGSSFAKVLSCFL